MFDRFIGKAYFIFLLYVFSLFVETGVRVIYATLYNPLGSEVGSSDIFLLRLEGGERGMSLLLSK